MNLIIFDKDFKNIDLINSQKKILSNNKNYLINFSSKNLSLPDWFIYKTLDISNLIFLEYKKNRPNLIKKIKNNLTKSPIFAEYKLSEINYSDSVWRTYFEILAIKSFVKKKNIKKIIVFSENKKNYLSLGLSEHFKRNYFHLYTYNNFYYYFRKFLVAYFIYLNNFRQELMLSFVLKIFHKKKTFSCRKILYANFPNHWNIKSKHYKLLEKKKDNKYLISLLRNNSSALKDFKNFFLLRDSKIKNTNILESYNSMLDIIFIYFKNLISKNQNVTCNFLKELHLGFFNNEVERNYRLIERCKNESFKNSLKNFNKINKIKVLVFPFFEFIDGRIISKHCRINQIESFGFQHSNLLANSHSRLFDATKSIYTSKLSEYLPKKIFIESLFAKQELSELKSIEIKYYGSFRFNNVLTFKQNKKNKKNILIVMDLHNRVHLEKIFEKIKFRKDSLVYIRPHPVYHQEYKKKKFNNLTIDLSTNLLNSIKKNKISYVFLSSSTGSFMDLINTNLNIIIYKVPNHIRDDVFFNNYFYTTNNLTNLNNLSEKRKMNISVNKNILLPKKIKKDFYF